VREDAQELQVMAVVDDPVFWSAEWENNHAHRWMLNGRRNPDGSALYVPAVPLTDIPNPVCPRPRILPDSNDSVKTIRALEEQLRSHVAVKGIEQ
jgi:hypothetical protein